MKAKIKLKQAFETYNCLVALGELELPIKLSYWVAKITKKLQPDIDPYNKTVKDYILKHGALNKETNKYEIKESEEQTKATNEFNKIQEETDVSFEYQEIPLNLFDDLDIKPSILTGIVWLIAE
jgi:Holliday junction resolvase RusA-like endonuclease